MAHLIDKAALVAEIDRMQKILNLDDYGGRSVMAWSEGFKKFLNTLEVKEVDLERELSYEDYVGFFIEHPNFPDDWGFDEAWVFAKHFFELGLKAKKGE